jgi:prolipoprotein diacylglyceryltransferase
MVACLSAILWEASPEIWPSGSVPLRWYGLLFAAAFFFGQIIISYIFKRDGKPEKDVDMLTYYMIGATVFGARLGHCLFYDPAYYLSHPLDILKIWEGGLASHGATLGILVAMWLYSRKKPDQSWLWILDRIVIVVALGGALIRMGNLMNSEIIGKPANTPLSMIFLHPFERILEETEGRRLASFAFSKTGNTASRNGLEMEELELHLIFQRDALPGNSAEAFWQSAIPQIIAASNGRTSEKYPNGDEPHLYFEARPENVQSSITNDGLVSMTLKMWGIPRHPAMVYESLSTFLLFILLFGFWHRYRHQWPEGRLFGIFVVVLFSLRFFYEFLKENQSDFEDNLSLNMGQILSIPLVLFGVYLILRQGMRHTGKA